MTRKLPRPADVFRIGQARLELYEAKRGYAPAWTNETLRQIVLQARKGFWRHGDVELEDHKDPTSFVYLVRASYDVHGLPVEEWVSLRFIPGDGGATESLAWDLDVCLFDGIPLRELVRERLFAGASDDVMLPAIASISRLCGTAPFFVDARDAPRGVSLPARKRYTAEAFALANLFFLSHAGRRFRFFTTLINDILLQKIFPELHFTSAQDALGLPCKKISIQRTVWSYQFPGNFLQMDELFSVLIRLLREKKITEETIQAYFGTILPFPEIHGLLLTDKPRYFSITRHMGKLLNASGRLVGSTLTGEELRALVDAEVTDGPELKILAREAWRKELEHFLSLKGSASAQRAKALHSVFSYGDA